MITSIFPLFEEVKSSCPYLDGRYRLLMTLGEGRHARVRLAYDEKTKAHLAIKMVPKFFNELQASLLHNEVKALVHLSKGGFTSINSFNFFGQVELANGRSYKTAYYTMKVEDNGEFYRVIERTGGFEEKIARKLFIGLLEGVKDIHDRNICHRDIKTENILVSRDFKLKLCDFGACSSINPKACHSQDEAIKTPIAAIGSPEFNPPEINYGKNNLGPDGVQKAEIFSLGCALFLMVVNSLPFSCASLQDPYYKRLCGANVNDFWRIFDRNNTKYSIEFKDLIQRMTKFNPSERISLHEILSHPWINSPDLPSSAYFRKSMEYRLKQVSEYYKEKALNEIEDLKTSKKKLIEDEGWELPESLEEFLFSIKPNLLKMQKKLSSFSHSDGFDSSSDSSSIHEQSKSKAKEIKPGGVCEKFGPGIQLERNSNSFDGFSSDNELN